MEHLHEPLLTTVTQLEAIALKQVLLKGQLQNVM